MVNWVTGKVNTYPTKANAARLYLKKGTLNQYGKF